MSDTT